MKKQFIKTISISLIFGLFITFSFNDNTYSQQLNKPFDKPGGSGSNSTNTQVDSNDNTMFYILGAAIVAGIVVYALMKDKDEKPVKDTTASILDDDFLERQLTISDKVIEYQSKIPISVSIGIYNNKMLTDENRYFIGMSYNF